MTTPSPPAGRRRRGPERTPAPGRRLRPTARGIVVALAAVLLWVIGDLTELTPARSLAAGLLLCLAAGIVCILLCGIGLRARRSLVDDAVPLGSSARVQVRLADGALFPTLPLGRGVLREHLPDALGGRGDLPLARRMPHTLAVPRRGAHALGPFSIVVEDVLGMFRLTVTAEDGARIAGLPRVEIVEPLALAAAGISREGAGRAVTGGIGEIGAMARVYEPGDDIRRVHWRASARTGRLMTREEEPAGGHSAVIVLDTSRREGIAEPQRTALEDRLVSHAASVLEALGAHGWEVRVLDASGDEITRTERRMATRGASPLGLEADAGARRAALLALADVGFDDDPASFAAGRDHAAGHTALAIALGADDGAPFSGLDLDRFAGRAAHRTALALRCDGDGDGASEGGGEAAPAVSRLGAWTLVRGTSAEPVGELLAAAADDGGLR